MSTHKYKYKFIVHIQIQTYFFSELFRTGALWPRFVVAHIADKSNATFSLPNLFIACSTVCSYLASNGGQSLMKLRQLTKTVAASSSRHFASWASSSCSCTAHLPKYSKIKNCRALTLNSRFSSLFGDWKSTLRHRWKINQTRLRCMATPLRLRLTLRLTPRLRSKQEELLCAFPSCCSSIFF